MKIKNECVVSIHYVLTDDEGDELDSSGSDPLVYLHGAGSLIRGLERELDGKETGDSFSAIVEPALAYGEIDPRLVQDVPRALLARIEDLHVGMALESRFEDGDLVKFIVDEIGDDTVTVNANHRLAGKTLHFAVKVDSVREATREEVEHGHVH